MNFISHDDSLWLRILTNEDLPFCARLIEQAGWNQVDADWRRMMAMDPEGCFVAQVNGEKAGTIVMTCFEDVAWISMVLVDISFRGQGIGQKMFGKIVDLIWDRGVKTIRLDATHMGVNLYKKYGFREEYEVIRLTCEKVDHPRSYPRSYPQRRPLIKPLDMNDLASVVSLAKEITCTDRHKLLERLISEEGTTAYRSEEPEGKHSGFVVLRPGRRGWQIGPCIAEDISSGIDLLDTALQSIRGHKALVDIPMRNEEALQWAKDHHFTEQRRFSRMYAGQKVNDHPDRIFASFGPEKG